MTLDEMVDKIIAMAYSDSHVIIVRAHIKTALVHDLNANGQRDLSEEEITMMVCGDDEGEIPDELTKLYPNVAQELTEYWQ